MSVRRVEALLTDVLINLITVLCPFINYAHQVRSDFYKAYCRRPVPGPKSS